jgi:hypothetical protein
MAVSRFSSVNDIINRAAVEVGLDPAADVLASSNTAFTQMKYLLTSALQELMILFPWQNLIRSYSYTSGVSETGDLALPSDFAYMIDQTGWERSSNVPLIGPLSPQDWTYLLGRDLVGSTIYASFRFDQNQLRIFPNTPMPAGIQINFEYISRNLLTIDGSNPVEYSDEPTQSADIVQLPADMVIKMLKAMFLDAKSMDSTGAWNAFARSFSSWSGKDNGAKIVNAAGAWRGFPYVDSFRNLPDTGYGA